MDFRKVTPRAPPAATADMDYTEELLAEVDEPPDERKEHTSWMPPKFQPAFGKANPAISNRRESLLTRQLHSETDHTDEEENKRTHSPPPRTLSTQSTWSNPSIASTAELTSDDGHSVASPAVSPPLSPTAITSAIPRFISEKPLTKEPTIVGLAKDQGAAPEEKNVEEGLGRKRCISFACGNKNTPPPVPAPAPPKEAETPAASPPKRKCMLKFACPTRPGSEKKVERPANVSRRTMSPSPPERKSSARAEVTKVHRGSDSTVTHVSPKNARKSPILPSVDSAPTTPRPTLTRKMSNDSDRSTEATRFHEFASSDDEPEEWVLESTCHRSRLTINDTLQKEIVLRKACEEVEEEAVEEEEDEDELEDEAELDDEEDDDDLDEESDEGFHTDDEEGFAESESEGEGSDEEWWRPGGLSTAATSIEQHMDRMTITRPEREGSPSSIESTSPGNVEPPRMIRPRPERKSRQHNMPIHPRKEAMDLPDSTDFVCGTLDEDRPLEQAYLNHIKQREAAKHKARPQDIDPTFPTSDPDMDEEDDEDLEDPDDSDHETLMHGNIDELDGDCTARRRSIVHRSPPPPARRRSPAPGLKRQGTARSPPPPARHRSPVPALKRQGTARSPPPPTRHRSPPPPARHRSPAPALKRQSTIPRHSPAPKATRRNLTGRSPPLLFGAVQRERSPLTPGMRFTSPPNTRRSSPYTSDANVSMPHVLASRPQLTHTASLPRGGGFTLRMPHALRPDEEEDSDAVAAAASGDLPKRGAIDIFKGLEKKRQRRKEKLYQKACAKAAAKGEKAYKVKPGRGAERMREVGLEMQRYHGKGEHILSL
ncbi:uncharacterized protein RCC_08186 [Ramularia collo-cygni]|uniref:Extensin domain-containing protein n=1 Tax=Ramularia collo-cygni TaxID=112498 RepID=A0A2D3VBX0_9PEZI|nr:uncharacterized protein RCC_08186 [Ramularia collo-cygni]CZT22317.1 uncharacterized protein RCC_08186 [Ramularia collo-cygni]